MLYTLIVAARFWVRELGGAGPGTVAGAEAVAGAGTVVGAGAGTVLGVGVGAGTGTGTGLGPGPGTGTGAGAAWCCLKRAFLSWACWKTEAIKKKKNNQISITHYSQNW